MLPAYIENIYKYLSVKQYIKLRYIHPYFKSRFIDDNKFVAYKIYQNLQKLFGDKFGKFIQLFENNNCIINGSYILQSILDVEWIDTDINIIVPTNLEVSNKCYCELYSSFTKIYNECAIRHRKMSELEQYCYDFMCYDSCYIYNYIYNDNEISYDNIDKYTHILKVNTNRKFLFMNKGYENYDIDYVNDFFVKRSEQYLKYKIGKKPGNYIYKKKNNILSNPFNHIDKTKKSITITNIEHIDFNVIKRYAKDIVHLDILKNIFYVKNGIPYLETEIAIDKIYENKIIFSYPSQEQYKEHLSNKMLFDTHNKYNNEYLMPLIHELKLVFKYILRGYSLRNSETIDELLLFYFQEDKDKMIDKYFSQIIESITFQKIWNNLKEEK